MNIGILKESKEETRVSVTPDIVDALKKNRGDHTCRKRRWRTILLS